MTDDETKDEKDDEARPRVEECPATEEDLAIADSVLDRQDELEDLLDDPDLWRD